MGQRPTRFFRHFLTTRVKRRVTRSEVVAEFKALFMGDVKEAADLPDRHLYPYEDEQNDDGEDCDSNAESPDNPVAVKKARKQHSGNSYRQYWSMLEVSVNWSAQRQTM
jgi:hypothetical protein